MKLDTLSKDIGSAIKLNEKPSAGQNILSDAKVPGFLDYLKGALGEVDQLQKTAAVSADKLAMGEGYLHNTFIAYEKANLALQLSVEVRNRIVEAYQEIMRMQV